MADAPEGPGGKGPEPDKTPAAKPAPAAPPKPKADPVEEALRRTVPSAALDSLKDAFPDVVLEEVHHAGQVTAVVPKERIVEILRFLHDDPRTAFDLLTDLTALDYPKREARFDVVYHLYSIPKNHRLRLKVRAADGETVPSATAVYNAAEWHEREVFDMFGVKFDNHPDLRRILLPDEWQGHPLRKEYPLEGFPEQHMRLR
jgi:NADH-quinone oxidoreductase subunit C